MDIPLAQVIGQNQHLSQRMLAVQSILNAVRPTGQPCLGVDLAMKIPFAQAVVLWTAGHIGPRGIVSQDGMMVLIQMFGKHLMETAEVWEKELKEEKKELTPMVLAIADRRLVQLTGIEGCYDLHTCRPLKKLPLTFEGISYNIAVPVRLEWLRIQRENSNVADGKAQAGAPQFRHPGNSAPGAVRRPPGPGGPAMGPGHGADGVGGGARNQASDRMFEQAYGSDRDRDGG